MAMKVGNNQLRKRIDKQMLLNHLPEKYNLYASRILILIEMTTLIKAYDKDIIRVKRMEVSRMIDKKSEKVNFSIEISERINGKTENSNNIVIMGAVIIVSENTEVGVPPLLKKRFIIYCR
jgi:hypothetical protein